MSKLDNTKRDYNAAIKEYLTGHIDMTDSELVSVLNKEDYESLFYVLHLVTNYISRHAGESIPPRYVQVRDNITSVREYKRIEGFVNQYQNELHRSQGENVK